MIPSFRVPDDRPAIIPYANDLFAVDLCAGHRTARALARR